MPSLYWQACVDRREKSRAALPFGRAPLSPGRSFPAGSKSPLEMVNHDQSYEGSGSNSGERHSNKKTDDYLLLLPFSPSHIVRLRRMDLNIMT